MDLDLLYKLKKLTISALVSDEILMGLLVLKGGNALDIAYDLSKRGSIDIDFSIENDFSASEKIRIANQLNSLLNEEFNKEGLSVFDVKFSEKPNIIDDSVKDFWGGYLIEFKIIETNKILEFKHNISAVRRYAIPIKSDNSTKFTVDISKYEYIGKVRPKDIDGSVVYVYTPEMLAIEKLRALCQQVKEYKKIVISITRKSRARDFYDIHNITETFHIEFNSKENIQLMKNIFNAKKVPLDFVLKLHYDKELHKGSWETVKQTINQAEEIKDFDFYFEYVINKFSFIKQML